MTKHKPKGLPVVIRDQLPLGTVVHDITGHPWVYTGKHKKGGRTFVATQPLPPGLWEKGHVFYRVTREACVKQFPDLAEHLAEDMP